MGNQPICSERIAQLYSIRVRITQLYGIRVNPYSVSSE